MNRATIIKRFFAACDTAKRSPYWMRQITEGVTDCVVCHQLCEPAPILRDDLEEKAMHRLDFVPAGAHVCAGCRQDAIGKDLRIEDIKQVPLSFAYIMRHAAELARQIEGRTTEQRAVEQFAKMVAGKPQIAPAHTLQKQRSSIV